MSSCRCFWILAAAAVALAAAGADAPPPGETRHAEKGGGFSYVPPEGWECAETPGFRFSMWLGPLENKFRPNIVVTSEESANTLADYVAVSLKTLEKGLTKFKLLEQSECKTATGAPAVRLATQSEQDGTALAQTFYFTAGHSGTQVVVTCTALLADGPRLAKLFDASFKSFRLEAEPKKGDEDGVLTADGRLLQKSGGYSVTPPPKWEVREAAGLKFRALMAPGGEGFRSNLTFVDETTDAKLAEYVAQSAQALAALSKDLKQTSEAAFATEAGAAGVKIVIERPQGESSVRQCLYFFDSTPRKKLVITATGLPKDAATWEPLADACVKSLRFEPAVKQP